ncbi:MAG: hypothetical protein M1830_006163 [Pleopsidium flavum]|nr:MAG: hypothetical protein M1830_006163 [Pleopsidium flavum]
MFGDVCNLVGPLIRDLSKENNEMDIDPAAGKESQSTIREKTVAAAVRALLNSLNPRIHPDVGASLSQILELLNITGSSRSRAVMEATFEGEEVLYGKLHGQEPKLHSENTEEILVQFARNLIQSMHQDDTESLRLKRANAILAFAGVSHINPHLVTSLEQGVTGARDAERSNIVRQKLDRALLILHERSP